MNGYSYKGQRKLTVSECYDIDIFTLKKIGGLSSENCSYKFVWCDEDNNKVGIVKKGDILNFKYVVTNKKTGERRIYDYPVNITYTKCNYGGSRSWFICPICGRRVAKLYAKNDQFCCRTCNNLSYRSCQTSGDIMAQVDRKIYKLQDKLKMKRKVYRTGGIRPKGMHQDKYDKLLNCLWKLYSQKDKIFEYKCAALLSKRSFL